MLEQTQGLHLHAKFDQNAFTMSVFLWPKTNHDLWQILTFGGSCTDPLLPIRAKFGVLEQTQGLHLQANFHLNVFIVLATGGQKPQFRANFDIFGGSCTDPLLPMRAKFGEL